ncbi:hypothetical protein [Rhizohabitans arisaemae]|uniref:hypothetical protein n=1 Tax=Rhizohabitans arisaemae TaxID=2720610 RepID=UPI0024B05D32|nr:hypothetical protein [Rhizohabitans arisaemae]
MTSSTRPPTAPTAAPPAYLGLEFQRSFASNTLRGVAADAAHIMGPLAAHARHAPGQVGL